MNTTSILDKKIEESSWQRNSLAQIAEGVPVDFRPELKDLVNFRGYQHPMQRWFKYREGYSISLAEKFLQEFPSKKSALDPFCGCGTTVLAARHMNIPSIGIEINPVFSLLSKVKVRDYTKDEIHQMRHAATHIANTSPDGLVRKTAFPLAQKVFNAEILQELLQIREYIVGYCNSSVREVLNIAWLSVIEEVSNIRKEGNGIKYRFIKRTPKGYIPQPQREWEKSNIPPNARLFVRKKVQQKICDMADDIEKSRGCDYPPARIIHGDCLSELEKWGGEIGTVLFSPPYCNCFDYFEIHKVELWMGEYVKTAHDMRKLRARGFCSNFNADLSRSKERQFDAVENIVSKLEMRPLWSKRIPHMVRGYFSDFARLLSVLSTRMKKNSAVGIVVGNSAYSGVIVPTDVLIAKIAPEMGFKVRNFWVCRHLTTSPQQLKLVRGLREYLRESMIVLSRDG